MNALTFSTLAFLGGLQIRQRQACLQHPACSLNSTILHQSLQRREHKGVAVAYGIAHSRL